MASETSNRMKSIALAVAFGIVKSSVAFLPASTHKKWIASWGKEHYRTSTSDPLFGIAEWRDTLLDQFPGTKGRTLPITPGSSPKASNALPHEICVLPFSHEDCLVQGQTKNLHLHEDRYIRLFDYCMTHHSGVVAMGLVADTGVIQTVPLCEIESFSRIEGFGIFATIRVVGRASLIELMQQEPYIRALGVEISDCVPPSFDVPNLLASNIENTMITLASLEYKLHISEDKDYGSEEDITEDDENDIVSKDVNEQFQYAFHQALNSDTQGYTMARSSTLPSSSSSSSFLFKGLRSVQQLTALSWSAFCITPMDVSYKLQALDCNDLFDRLKLAAYALRELKQETEAKVALLSVETQSRDKNNSSSKWKSHQMVNDDDEEDDKRSAENDDLYDFK